MSGRIYIASSSAVIVPNAHTYLVYDKDGNTDTFDDQYIINAGPSGFGAGGIWGNVTIQSDLEVQSSVHYKIDTDDDGIKDRDPEDYYHYTELTWATSLTAKDMWFYMVSVANGIPDAPRLRTIHLSAPTATRSLTPFCLPLASISGNKRQKTS